MIMEKWKHFPGVFRRKILLTALTGLGCGTVAAVVFFVSDDRTMMVLGGIILLSAYIKPFPFGTALPGSTTMCSPVYVIFLKTTPPFDFGR